MLLTEKIRGRALALYLLDKNIIEDIHHSLKGRASPLIAAARSIDVRRNTVSPILAILEGGVQRPQTRSETVDQISLDSSAINRFYRYARTDSEYLKTAAVEMAAVLGAHWRDKAGSLIPICKSLQSILARTYSRIDARGALERIVAECERAQLELSHPLATCAVSCLYGSKSARKVINPSLAPTEEVAYNAVSDIRMIMESAYIRHIWNSKSRREPVHLLSRDAGLNDFARAVSVRVETATPDATTDLETVTYRSNIGKVLFPSVAADSKELQRVMSIFESGGGR